MHFQSLESRRLLAGNMPSITFAGTTLTITGTDGADSVELYFGDTTATITSPTGTASYTVDPALIEHVVINLLGGQDFVRIDQFTSRPRLSYDFTIDTGADDDTVSLQDIRFDVIQLGDGDDDITMEACVGNRLELGNGDDHARQMFAASSASEIFGGDGDDIINLPGTVDAGDGNDTVNLYSAGPHYMGRGNDNAYAFTEADSSGPVVIYGGAGNDTLELGSNYGQLHGGDGDDHLHGNADLASAFFGDTGHDFISAEVGDHYLDGGDGDDTLLGGDGDDVFYPAGGNDSILGGDGTDTVRYRGRSDAFDFRLTGYAVDPRMPEDGHFQMVATRILGNAVDLAQEIEGLEGTEGADRLLLSNDIGPVIGDFDFNGRGGYDTIRIESDLGTSGPSIDIRPDRIFTNAFNEVALIYSGVDQLETRNGALYTTISDIPASIPVFVENAGEDLQVTNSAVVISRPTFVEDLILTNAHIELRAPLGFQFGGPTVGSSIDIRDQTLTYADSSFGNPGRTAPRTLVASGRVFSSLMSPDLAIGIFERYSGTLPDYLIHLALPGDANGDGAVNVSDLGTVATHFRQSNSIWSDGDFNHDGVIDVADLGILSANFRRSGGPVLATAVFSTKRITTLFNADDGMLSTTRKVL